MNSHVRGAIRRAALPASFDGLWSRMRKRPAGSMLPKRLPSVDVGGLAAHADYLNERRREDPTLGRNQLCVLLAQARRVYCSVKTMQKWLSRHAAPSAIEAAGVDSGGGDSGLILD